MAQGQPPRDRAVSRVDARALVQSNATSRSSSSPAAARITSLDLRRGDAVGHEQREVELRRRRASAAAGTAVGARRRRCRRRRARARPAARRRRSTSRRARARRRTPAAPTPARRAGCGAPRRAPRRRRRTLHKHVVVPGPAASAIVADGNATRAMRSASAFASHASNGAAARTGEVRPARDRPSRARATRTVSSGSGSPGANAEPISYSRMLPCMCDEVELGAARERLEQRAAQMRLVLGRAD